MIFGILLHTQVLYFMLLLKAYMNAMLIEDIT